MAPPVAVYVFAAVVSVAAVFAFKEFVYEPHIAPKLEAWAEDFLERRRTARNRRASAVPVRTSRRRHSSSSSSSTNHNNDLQRDRGSNDRELGPNDLSVDGLELEALVSREVDEWRNEVLRSQEITMDGLRKRRTERIRDDFDSFATTSMTTLDESFTSLTHTPLEPTHVISNISSPITPSTVSLPLTPTRRLRSESQSTTTQGDASTFTLLIAPQSPPSPTHDMPVMSPTVVSPGSADPTPRPLNDGVGHFDITSPSPFAIPNAIRNSPATEGAPHPLPFTPTNQVMADDSPFGPLLQDTPRSGAEIYGERPFSPITRVMGSSSSHVPAAGSKAPSSRSNSMSSIRTLGSSGVLRRGSGLANQVVTTDSDDGSDEESHPHASRSTFESVISSLSERYPAPPTPPIIISSPASSVGIISIPSSPRSGGSEVVIQYDALATAPQSPSLPLPQTHSSLPLLQLPSDSLSPRLTPRSRSPAHSATSPALSYASFLSPMPISRSASESEGDEFLSVASDDSDWSASPVTPSGHMEPVQDMANNPFLDFEHLTHNVRGNGSEHGDGSEGSEVLVSDLAQERASEVGSDESWGSARRH
ncbi:hypothetical protein J3R82DRAFT_4826 [Butyriboletus roseoflavus]|nr:hypothetical protein J3R82DRAFT_4826 [Butyriboletus roseoflavus]